ncbi:glycosyltransferase family 1 protein [Saccharopolyspora sp. K220]|uniref:glycosyltransferase family 4 protein n=1 Tax=Saccharopolyspora soli TaxID=2926618 RepID=UPI001F593AEE|nr:glycosyltransferase family 1 protein [Saccharopolyspora soli]MCI2417040.1 glycosyltransferase family 1 protein [Saccharopolyspora soli]
MRIAIVTESFLPQINGVANSVLRVLEHLRRRGDAALVIAPGAGPQECEGFPVIRLPAVELPLVSSLPIGFPTRRLLRGLQEFQPDVVHLASPFIVGARGLAAARRIGVPTVAVYQTDVAGFAESYGLGLTARAAWRWIRRLHGAADRTLAPSTWAVDALREHGIPRVHRWGRGVDTVRFSPRHRDSDLHRELAPNGELLVGYVGRLAPEKRIERLAALDGMPGVRLVVVGDGPERGGLTEALPGAVFLGQRTGDELARIYASLDVFAHTGPHETFCQAVQEAMASGVPVVAPDAGGPRDLVDHNRTGYLLPADDDAVHADALRAAVTALREPGLRERFGEAARAAVAGRTWPALCQQLIGHYTAVAASAESLAA